MPSIIRLVCGKIVNSMGIHRQKVVDERPQNDQSVMMQPSQAVYNHNFVPVLTSHFPHFYPQAFMTNFYLLMSSFSPLSTLPITTTTNLKKEER